MFEQRFEVLAADADGGDSSVLAIEDGRGDAARVHHVLLAVRSVAALTRLFELLDQRPHT